MEVNQGASRLSKVDPSYRTVVHPLYYTMKTQLPLRKPRADGIDTTYLAGMFVEKRKTFRRSTNPGHNSSVQETKTTHR